MLSLVRIRTVVRRSERLHNRLGIAEQPCFQARADLYPYQFDLFERIVRWEVLNVATQALKSFMEVTARFNTSFVSSRPFVVYGKYNLLVATAL